MSGFAMMSPRQKLWLVSGTLAGAVLVLIGYFALVGPQRSHTDSIATRVNQTRIANSALRAHIASLQTQNLNRTTYQAQARAAMAALPATSGMPAFLRTLQALGTQTNTDAVNVSVGAPTDVTAVATGAAVTNATAATPAPVAATSTPPANQVWSLPITVQVNGSPTALGQFLQQLQQKQPRAVLITQIIQGSGSGPNPGSGTSTVSGSNLQLTMQAFVAPGMATTAAQLGHS